MKQNITLSVFLLTISLSSLAGKPWIFGGIGFGYVNSTEDNVTLLEPDKNGFSFDASLSASIYHANFVYDFGVGYFHSNVEGDKNNTKIKVKVNTAFVDFGARYKITENIYLGGFADLYFGTDNSYSNLKDDTSLQPFLGLRADYEFPFMNGKKMRFLGKISRSMSIDDRAVTMASLGFQIGFDVFGNYRKVKIIEKEKVRYVLKYKQPLVEVIGKNSLRATITKETGLFFNTNKASANAKMQSYIKRLSSVLRKNKNEWTSIAVEGHTDDTGTLNYNMALSKKRANLIKAIFVRDRIPSSKISTIGYGPTRPLDPRKTKLARAKNRRVELIFKGVQNPHSFKEKLFIIE